MKKLIVICIVLGGCATKPKPMWDWCVDTPTRQIKCEDLKTNLINQDHLRRFQTDVGIRKQKVQIVK